MTKLADVGQSLTRLRALPPRNEPELTNEVWHHANGVSFARVTLGALGFTEPPTWEKVLDRVSEYGEPCILQDVPRLSEALTELADCVRPALQTEGHTMLICLGDRGYPLFRDHFERHYRFWLGMEVVYRLAA